MKPKPELLAEKKNTRINWEEINNKLNAANQMLETKWELSGEQKKNILRDRAKVLSKEPASLMNTEKITELIEFSLAHEGYAIETTFVLEVVPLKSLTPLSTTPAFLLGITNVRGRILSVIDLKKFFNLPEKGITDLNKLIIIHSNEIEFGILADSIIGVKYYNLDDVQNSLPDLKNMQAEFLKGVTKEGVIILDCEKILNDKRIIINDGF